MKTNPRILNCVIYLTLWIILAISMYKLMPLYATQNPALNDLESVQWFRVLIPLIFTPLPAYLITITTFDILKEVTVFHSFARSLSLIVGSVVLSLFLVYHFLLTLTVEQFNLIATVLGLPIAVFAFKILDNILRENKDSKTE